jgi:6-phosphogluconolactonase
MQIEILPNADAVAARAATLIAAAARAAVQAREVFTIAVSGGHTPWQMLRALANEQVPWAQVHVFQVDERIAPPATRIATSRICARACSRTRRCRSSRSMRAGRRPRPRYAAAPVPSAAEESEEAPEPVRQMRCTKVCVLTASLVPGDSVLEVTDADVALTGGTYQNRRRMTLTYPVLNRARQILWVVTGAEKVDALRKLRAADPSIPAGRVDQTRATLLADRAAAG